MPSTEEIPKNFFTRLTIAPIRWLPHFSFCSSLAQVRRLPPVCISPNPNISSA